MTVGFHELPFLNTHKDELKLPALGQAFNRYSYVGNNPIINIDPTGHEEVSVHQFSKEQAQEFVEAIDVALLENEEGTTLIEFLTDSILPSVGSGVGAGVIVALLEAAGYTIAAVSSVTIGIIVSVAVGMMYAWNSTARSNGLITLGHVRDNLFDAIEASDSDDVITMTIRSKFGKDKIRIVSHDANYIETGGSARKYSSVIESYFIDDSANRLKDWASSYLVYEYNSSAYDPNNG